MNNRIEQPSPTAANRRGRPLAEENTDFREQILDSAEQLFASASFESVSIRQIALPVGVTPAMIHYYFGNKQNLLEEVLERAIQPMAAAVSSLREEKNPRIESFVREFLATLKRHPNLPLLMMRQVFLPGGPMQSHFVEKLAPRLGGALPGLIRKGQMSGQIDAHLDPAITSLLTLSMCVFPLISKPLSQPALGVSFDSPGLEKLELHVIHFLEQGLNPA